MSQSGFKLAYATEAVAELGALVYIPFKQESLSDRINFTLPYLENNRIIFSGNYSIKIFQIHRARIPKHKQQKQ